MDIPGFGMLPRCPASDSLTLPEKYEPPNEGFFLKFKCNNSPEQKSVRIMYLEFSACSNMRESAALTGYETFWK